MTSDFEKALTARIHELYECKCEDKSNELFCPRCGTYSTIYRIAARWANEWYTKRTNKLAKFQDFLTSEINLEDENAALKEDLDKLQKEFDEYKEKHG